MINKFLTFFLLIGSIFLSVNAAAEGEVQDLKDFEYWDNGKVKQCTVYGTDGHLKAKAFCRYNGTAEKIERYDIYGNKIEQALYDDRGKLKTGIDGWAAMRWRYDGPVLVSQISYDENGVPIDKKFYSESGKLMARLYRDDERMDPYENAAMHILLGGKNIRYHEPNVRPVDDGIPTVKD